MYLQNWLSVLQNWLQIFGNHIYIYIMGKFTCSCAKKWQKSPPSFFREKEGNKAKHNIVQKASDTVDGRNPAAVGRLDVRNPI